MRQVSHKVSVDAHLYQLSLRTEYVNEFDTHGLYIEGCVLTQIEKDLQTVDVEEFTCKLTRAIAIVVTLVKEQDFEEFEHLHVEAGT